MELNEAIVICLADSMGLTHRENNRQPFLLACDIVKMAAYDVLEAKANPGAFGTKPETLRPVSPPVMMRKWARIKDETRWQYGTGLHRISHMSVDNRGNTVIGFENIQGDAPIFYPVFYDIFDNLQDIPVWKAP